MILCLGKRTFEGVLDAFSIENPIRKSNYNDYIEKRLLTEIVITGEKMLRVFPLAHCGVFGTMNRNACCGRSGSNIEKQKEDWEYIKNYL